MRHVRYCGLAALLILPLSALISTTAATSAAAQTAGLVVRAEGIPQSGIAGTIRRADRRIDLRIGQPLRVGDLVEIAYPVESIEVDVGRKERLKLERAKNPHDISQSMNLGSQQQALINMITAPPPPAPVTVVQTGSRTIDDQPPASPLEATAQDIAPDATSLPVAWTGGAPPFRVRVESGPDVVAEARADGRFATVVLSRPLPASARLVIRDARDRELRIALRAVPAVLPAALRNATLESPSLLALIEAMAIAEGGEGRRLDAARRAHAIAADNPAAMMYRDGWLGVAPASSP